MLINCHSRYSLSYGCLSIEEVIETAKSLGHRRFALTDISNTSETFRFVREAHEKGIEPVVGIDFRNGVEQQFVALAQNNSGFAEINQYLSEHQHVKKKIAGKPAFKEAHLIYPFSEKAVTDKLAENEWIGVKPADLKRLNFDKTYAALRHKMVAMCTATFRNKRDYNAHCLLRAIGENALLSNLPKDKQADETDQYLSEVEIEKQFEGYPQILANTLAVLEDCTFHFDFEHPRNNKAQYTESKEADFELLKKLSYEGVPHRYGFSPTQKEAFTKPQEEIVERLEKELRIIRDYGFCAYFLINWDMVQYGRRKGYPYVGRGSGANSMVAYLISITNVDPIELDLYFERFINPHRKSPPDFDIDFSWTDRDDVTRYLFETHGYDRVALVGAYITFKQKAVIRELGKVFGLPSEEIEKLQRYGNPSDEYGKLVLKYSAYIAGFPSHLSVHASGIIISEKPMNQYTATFMPPKGYPTVHFDMQIAEDIGLHKFDILSQRGLGKIKDAVIYIKQNRGVEVDIDDMQVIKADQKVKSLLREGDLTGCFYVESPAMRMLMAKLRAEDYTRLVAASSIIRPGVAKSGMMREYILRFRKPELQKAAREKLPELYDILAETYGVMVYQEDVLKVAHYFAELTLAESDILRRGMSWNFRKRPEFHRVEKKFFDNCKRLGYAQSTTHKIWEQISSFANFAFSKGHSASYAVESFQALYLHAYYPLEYLTATLNNGGGFYSRELYVHTARMKGATIELPCINRSEDGAHLQGDTLWLGLGFIQGSFEVENRRSILLECYENGVFKSLRDFMTRLPQISLDQLIVLIRLGCFRIMEPNKKKLLWDAHFILSGPPKKSKEASLFQVSPQKWSLPKLAQNKLEDALDEVELLGFPVTYGPFELIKKEHKLPVLKARDLSNHIGKEVQIAGYKVHSKRTRTSNGKEMSFGTFIDQDGHWIDTVMFPNTYQQNKFTGPGCFILRGIVSEEFEHISLEVSWLKRLENKVLVD